MRSYSFVFLLAVGLLAVSCRTPKRPQYVIGVSQCMDDAWRRKMNVELENEHIFYPEVTMRYRQADSNSELQCLQIDSFIQEGIDLLIVSPNEADEVEPAVSRAYRAGIPVVVADRRLRGDDYTAFVGGDNKQVGYIIARCLQKLSEENGGKLNVLEITGLPGSTPTVLRHQAMMEALRYNQDIRIVAQGCGEWLEAPSERMADSLLIVHPDVDVIVAQNDLMARGASAACQRHNIQIPIIGVDGITGAGGGVEAILDGIITKTATYPSRGDLVLQRAMQILRGEDYPRNTVLKSVLVGIDEAAPMALLAEERESEVAALGELKKKIYTLTNEYNLQRTITFLLLLLLIILVAVGVGVWRMMIIRQRLVHEREEKDRQLQRQQEQLRMMSEQLEQTRKQVPTNEELEREFVSKLCSEIEKCIGDSELSVEQLADALGMSRSVLFRRTKSATGQSPVELIRTLRLERAKKMLESGSLNVQQVAYEVGFSSPGYFAKCYKERFGVSPGNGKNRS